jgi:hypothetical protein
VRNRKRLPPLTEEQLLAWADAFRRRTGAWPTARSGPVPEAPGETWMAVAVALRQGRRGLPGGSSLPRLLAERRGARNRWTRPQLSVEQVLGWADAFRRRAGRWPHAESGPVPGAPGETWSAVDHALKRGARGLPGGLSLARLLARERGARKSRSLPRLSRGRILAWADAHHRRTGRWPTPESGPVPEAPGETWAGVNQALRKGWRGLRGGSSLARLLSRRGRKRNHLGLPPLSKRKILAWADAHSERTGSWPHTGSGPVAGVPGENWAAVDNALRKGCRGLPGGSSLLQLLVKKRGARDVLRPPPLTEGHVLRWAERHFGRTGAWPKYKAGAIPGSGGETWAGVDWALRYGKRGLPGGSSLAKLLADRHGTGREAGAAR